MEFLLSRDPFLHALQHLAGDDEHSHEDPSPAKAYLRERNAMASTAVDVKEYPSSYVYVADMPGLKSSDIKVTVESGNVLVLSGKRKREENADAEAKYLSIERKATKFMRKFALPGNAVSDQISAACQDGVLTVTVPKVAPPTPKIINIEVK
ncbi:hypothetical protein GOP47_0007224 [Adiantum capillus-veneris]|uniref:SHSP domain-containing protein n=1 Tax=Adiantum capillus-veneris TaxID=13818 RepID=A0A9D4V0A1_ADICA|nr:hypothetical protein GOP47_0007224 [Adiantum capillus-veneris]